MTGRAVSRHDPHGPAQDAMLANGTIDEVE